MAHHCEAARHSKYVFDAGGRLGERGSVTAEFAVVLPAVAVILAFLLAGAAAGAAQLNLEKAAQAAVRQLGRGESEATAVRTVRAIAGDGAALAAGTSDDWVTVQVTKRLPGPFPGIGGWTLEAEATSPVESSGGPLEAGSGAG